MYSTQLTVKHVLAVRCCEGVARELENLATLCEYEIVVEADQIVNHAGTEYVLGKGDNATINKQLIKVQDITRKPSQSILLQRYCSSQFTHNDQEYRPGPYC